MVGCAVLHGCTHSVAWAGHVYKSCTCVSISCRMSVPTLVSATHALANLKCTVGHTGIDAERAKSSELAGWRGSRRHRKAEGKRGLGLWTDAMRARSRSKVTVTLYRLPGNYGNPRLTPDPRARAPKKRKRRLYIVEFDTGDHARHTGHRAAGAILGRGCRIFVFVFAFLR